VQNSKEKKRRSCTWRIDQEEGKDLEWGEVQKNEKGLFGARVLKLIFKKDLSAVGIQPKLQGRERRSGTRASLRGLFSRGLKYVIL